METSVGRGNGGRSYDDDGVLRGPNGKKIGRPEGSVSKLAREAREKAMATGQLPHEIMLSIARGEIQTEKYLDKESGEILTRPVSVPIEMRLDAAKGAAPYYAPKMATVELTQSYSDDELDALIRELLADLDLSAEAGAAHADADGEEEAAGDSGSDASLGTAEGRSSRRGRRTALE